MNNFHNLIQELPESLLSLADSVAVLALDLRWTWSHEGGGMGTDRSGTLGEN